MYSISLTKAQEGKKGRVSGRDGQKSIVRGTERVKAVLKILSATFLSVAGDTSSNPVRTRTLQFVLGQRWWRHVLHQSIDSWRRFFVVLHCLALVIEPESWEAFNLLLLTMSCKGREKQVVMLLMLLTSCIRMWMSKSVIHWPSFSLRSQFIAAKPPGAFLAKSWSLAAWNLGLASWQWGHHGA